MMAIIPLLLAVIIVRIFATIETFDYYSEIQVSYYFDFNILTSLGKIALLSKDVISEATVLLGLSLALYYRFNLQKSSKIICWSFVLLLLIKLWPSLFQGDTKFNVKELEAKPDLIALIRTHGILQNGLDIIPLIIAIPRGAIAAAMTMLALAPASITPKVLVIFLFPFATLLLILGTSSLVQLAGDSLFAFSLGCFYLSDFLMYLSFSAVLEGNIKELSSGKKFKARLFLKIIGTILIMVWIFVKVYPCLLLAQKVLDDDSDDDWISLDVVHCTALLALDNFTPSRFLSILISIFRNLFLSKLIYTDFIITTMRGCEKEVSGF